MVQNFQQAGEFRPLNNVYVLARFDDYLQIRNHKHQHKAGFMVQNQHLNLCECVGNSKQLTIIQKTGFKLCYLRFQNLIVL